jgi:hypothetical protein
VTASAVLNSAVDVGEAIGRGSQGSKRTVQFVCVFNSFVLLANRKGVASSCCALLNEGQGREQKEGGVKIEVHFYGFVHLLLCSKHGLTLNLTGFLWLSGRHGTSLGLQFNLRGIRLRTQTSLEDRLRAARNTALRILQKRRRQAQDQGAVQKAAQTGPCAQLGLGPTNGDACCSSHCMFCLF